MTPVPRIELRHVPACPNVEGTRILLRDCLRDLGMEVPVVDLEGDYPSPTVLVDGMDVMGEPGFEVAGCRLDVPTRENLLAALSAAAAPRRDHP